jgi:hypothetical protein
VSGLVFNVVFASLAATVRQFQVVQHVDRSVTMRVVPTRAFDDSTRRHLLDTAAKYLGALPMQVVPVEDIPLAASGKRKVVVVERG